MTFTKEWLQHQIAEFESCAERTDGYRLDEGGKNTLAALKLALAGMEAEPVGEVSEQRDGLVLDGTVDLGGTTTHRIIKGASKMKRLPLGTKFYAAPQPLTTYERAELENYRNAQQVVPGENGLLPCPFCGSPAEHYPDGDMEGYSVMCGHKNGDCDSWVFGFSTPEEAEKSWNTRAAMLQAGNSPVIPDCSCRTCRPVSASNVLFIVCPDCGNKRCPHANDHRNVCTGRNDPGQQGSAYPAAPQQESE